MRENVDQNNSKYGHISRSAENALNSGKQTLDFARCKLAN